MGLLVRTFVRGRTALKELGSATVRVPREGPGSRATSLRIPTGSGVRLLREGEDPRVDYLHRRQRARSRHGTPQ